MACTFSLLVGGECGADPKSKTASRKIVPLVSCSKNISSHKKQLQFSGCETEIELILARSGCFQTPENIHDMTICPLHRLNLGIGWRRSKRVCSVPGKLSGHSEESKKNAERGCSLAQSKIISRFFNCCVLRKRPNFRQLRYKNEPQMLGDKLSSTNS